MTTSSNAYKVVMPKLGLIMEQAQLVEWHKQDQEWVEQGELLFSLESDKSIIEIEAPASGYLSIVIPAGQTVPVMETVAYLQQDGDTPSTDQVVSVDPVQQPQERKEVLQRTHPVRSQAGIKASPKARAVARNRNIQLSVITGTGPRGMIVTADLDQAPTLDPALFATPVAHNMAVDFGMDLSTVEGSGPGGRITRADLAAAVRNRNQQPAEIQPPDQLPLEGLRGIIAERLTASWNERPQVTLYAEVDAVNLMAARTDLSDDDQKISYNAFLMMAAAQALKEYPDLNVQLTSEAFRVLEEINIGLAVDTDRGLMVPVVSQADKKSIWEINQDITELVARTLEGKLLPDEYTGGSFTITNLGGFGVDAFSPIINPPESAILGVGTIKQTPVVKDGKVVVSDVVMLSLSFDHRVIDGAPAAQFFQHLCGLVEGPSLYAGLKK